MQTVQMLGGSSTASGRTATLIFHTTATLSSISVPVTLSDSTTATKYTTITVIINDYTFTERTDFDKTETGNRTLEFSIGYNIPAETTVTVKMSGSNVYVNYGAATPYALPGEIVVNSYSFEAALTIDYDALWCVSAKNEGYPFVLGFSPDESTFEGYQNPKPLNSWKLDGNNAGYPWTWGFDEIAQGQNIFYKTANGVIPLTAYYKSSGSLIPLIFIKQL